MSTTSIDRALAAHAVRIAGTFRHADWQEHQLSPEGAEGPKLANATVRNSYAGGIEGEGLSAYAITYFPDGTGGFSGLQLVTGRLDGRAGSFVLAEHGTFAADQSLTCEFTVMPGSGTGELAGLTGAGGYVYEPGTQVVPLAFGYSLPALPEAG
ncbi:Protein of unknown function [Streptomyces zhaozhouensis]|uniref:DUF3224 domain-containing protein n=1 Tax=Streptomyces zhaozhouensis TaxID=1300267 RepID=A0A286DZ88_9ACTN|nr:DUF3224 domain-containing protein [Streptomyces zhaozhouensis]SOD63961.1 Protein of unknown function [Streptomyces zhaozhouensis]